MKQPVTYRKVRKRYFKKYGIHAEKNVDSYDNS